MRKRFWILVLTGLTGFSLVGTSMAQSGGNDPGPGPAITGPFVDPSNAYPHQPTVLNESLEYRQHIPAESAEALAPVIQPLRYVPGQSPKTAAPQNTDWIDPVVQDEPGVGSMPAPGAGFPGLNFAQDGSGWPPDTNGDVGPNHYIQTVNTSLGIFDRGTGSILYRASFNQFFTGPADTPCDGYHRGDPIVLYDPFVDRWLVTDFAWYDQDPGFYQCLAVSQGPDPVSDGWYFYALRADTGNFEFYLNDYPKLGAWHDGWYMTANMFEMVSPNRFGVRVWALDRTRMIQGLSLREVHYDLCTQGDCDSLLPAHDNLAQADGSIPPPNYLTAARLPDELLLWRFNPDFDNPASSSFLGPVVVQVAPFAIAASITQPEQVGVLDSLSYRLMMQLQYRLINGIESLWLNHTVASGGFAAVRWYEIQQPGEAIPLLAQQGTYQPLGTEPGLQRWMGSLAVDRDGNMALGYSAASESVYPSIRVAGRLASETPGVLLQSELDALPGSGSQVVIHRWGDYTAMTVAPDGCTFYYTNQYFLETGLNWQTWIVPFSFPSCGSQKGTLQGTVRDAESGLALAGVEVRAASTTQTVTMLSDASGAFELELAEGAYTVTAGPQPPGYPLVSDEVIVQIYTGQTSSADLALVPYPALVVAEVTLLDSGPDANGNGVPEPGESDVSLWISLKNEGAATAETVQSSLISATPGVAVGQAHRPYADIPPGETVPQSQPYAFSLLPEVACGVQLELHQDVTDRKLAYSHDLAFDAALSQERRAVFNNDVEFGSLLWRTQGMNNTWAISSSEGYFSPAHAWSDSPGRSYRNNTDASLESPVFNLAGKRRVRVEFALKYSLEPGWDYLYLEYSLDGGQTWQPEPLASYSGFNTTWQVQQVEAPELDGQAQAALRFRLLSDISVVYNGVTLDDIRLTFEPFTCLYPVQVAPPAPVPLRPMAGELFRLSDLSGVTFEWLPGPSGAPVQGYRLVVDDLPAGDLPASLTWLRLPIEPGEHTWTVQAVGVYGASPLAELTRFWNPFLQILPLVSR